jgi:hypothetical protein
LLRPVRLSLSSSELSQKDSKRLILSQELCTHLDDDDPDAWKKEREKKAVAAKRDREMMEDSDDGELVALRSIHKARTHLFPCILVDPFTSWKFKPIQRISAAQKAEEAKIQAVCLPLPEIITSVMWALGLKRCMHIMSYSCIQAELESSRQAMELARKAINEAKPVSTGPEPTKPKMIRPVRRLLSLLHLHAVSF